jgi:hypothetical protein
VEEVETLLKKEAVALLQPPYSPGFYSSVFTVTKKDSEKLRLVINLRPLNRMLRRVRFKMETPTTITRALRQGDWTISIDLSDAYLHIPMHPTSWKYLRFVLGTRVFEFRALPFGLSPAPYVFTRVMATISQAAHKRMLHLFLYLDDSLLRSQYRQKLLLQLPILTGLFDSLGYLRNDKKSSLVPAQLFTFLGVFYDLVQALARIPEDRWTKIVHTIPLLQSRRMSPARDWCVLIGLLTSAQNYVRLGRLHVRRLQIHLNDFWVPRTDLGVLIPMSQECWDQLNWWLNRDHVMAGVPIHLAEPTVHLFTDASSQGWGAHLDNRLMSGLWSPQDKLLHINILEMKAVLLAVQQSATLLLNQSILVSTDNSTVVSYINKQGGTHSRSLFLLVEELLLLVEDLGSMLMAKHIPGARNVLADQLSRSGQLLSTEWTLHQSVVNRLFQLWGQPHMDLFATRFTARHPLFVAPYPDERAVAVDALAMNWDLLVGYAYPPTILLPRILEKIRCSSARILLIAPAWTTRSWFPSLLELLEDLPWVLPLREDLLSQPRIQAFHSQLEMLALHAWPLSGDSLLTADFQRKLRAGFHSELDSPLMQCTSPGGVLLSLGVRAGRWTLSRSLSLS